MRRARCIALGLLLGLLTACGGGSGKLYARVSSDAALAQPLTTADGWTLQFSQLVVAVSSFSVTTGNGSSGLSTAPVATLADFSQAARADLGANLNAAPQTYDHVTLVLSRSTAETNLNVPADVLSRVGNRTVWVEGSAVKQSTTRRFELGVTSTLTFESCMPPVDLEPYASVTVDWRVHAQRLFLDDLGALRFEAFAAADATPADGLVDAREIAAVMTSSLPAAQYGSTPGTLANVLQARALSLVGLGDSGTCSGR